MDNIKVAIRVRPLNEREISQSQECAWIAKNNSLAPALAGTVGKSTSSSYSFDRVFDVDSTNHDLYQDIAKTVVTSALDGVNATIFAYGQTSSGKTFTMKGCPKQPGIIPLAVRDVFDYVNKQCDRDYLIRVSYMEIYNEVIKDLLNPSNDQLKIHENVNKEIYVGNLTEEVAMTSEQVLKLMDKGELYRHVGGTNMNERSSRSHTLFRMNIESRIPQTSSDGTSSFSVRVSCLNMVDLAGSERADQTGAEGTRLKEGAHINKSLLALSHVISKLSEGNDGAHIPYRNSKLTRLLQTSLGGNARTAIICTVTPAASHMDESTSTLKFASRAKHIANQPIVNEIASRSGAQAHDDALQLAQKYQRDIDLLRQQQQQLQTEAAQRQAAQQTHYVTQLDEMEREKARLQEKLQRMTHLFLRPAETARGQPSSEVSSSPSIRENVRMKRRRASWDSRDTPLTSHKKNAVDSLVKAIVDDELPREEVIETEWMSEAMREWRQRIIELKETNSVLHKERTETMQFIASHQDLYSLSADQYSLFSMMNKVIEKTKEWRTMSESLKIQLKEQHSLLTAQQTAQKTAHDETIQQLTAALHRQEQQNREKEMIADSVIQDMKKATEKTLQAWHQKEAEWRSAQEKAGVQLNDTVRVLQGERASREKELQGELDGLKAQLAQCHDEWTKEKNTWESERRRLEEQQEELRRAGEEKLREMKTALAVARKECVDEKRRHEHACVLLMNSKNQEIKLNQDLMACEQLVVSLSRGKETGSLEEEEMRQLIVIMTEKQAQHRQEVALHREEVTKWREQAIALEEECRTLRDRVEKKSVSHEDSACLSIKPKEEEKENKAEDIKGFGGNYRDQLRAKRQGAGPLSDVTNTAPQIASKPSAGASDSCAQQ